MNSLYGSAAGNSVVSAAAGASPSPATVLPGVVPYPAAEVDRYMAAGAWGTRSLPTAFRQVAATTRSAQR
jgi:hypothetical protein